MFITLIIFLLAKKKHTVLYMYYLYTYLITFILNSCVSSTPPMPLDYFSRVCILKVTYCASGFLEKNNDTLHEDLRELLLSSRVPFLQQVQKDARN